MKSYLLPSLRALFLCTLVTGVAYPLVITLFARVAFPDAAGGSLVKRGDAVVGSRLIAQKLEDPRYFSSRPSASDFGAVPSGASNLSPASTAFVDAVTKRRAQWGAGAPADLLTTSGSGLDPHISPEAAYFQLARVAQARGLAPDGANRLRQLVERHIEGKTFGILGQNRVNVLELNLAVDESFEKGR